MAIYDTSNTIDNSIFLKAKLKKNMVGDNYYIENLQDKRNADWEYRYNRVDIEEELDKQIAYTSEFPTYTQVETVISNVKTDKGEDLGSDWAHLAFKDLKHPSGTGYRYRFSLDFPNMKAMTEEEKHFTTSIWIAVNKAPIRAGNSCTVRRCNTALTLVGSPSYEYSNITEVHYEPCIIENDLKYNQIYYNLSVPVPQAEFYATMQLNYFSNAIKINDRFLLGTMDTNIKEGNHAYKVKAVIKADTSHTFVRDSKDEIESTDLVVVALDKDAISPDDNFENRIASQASMYLVDTKKDRPMIDGEYKIISEDMIDFNDELFQTEEKTYEIKLVKLKDGITYWIDDAEFTYTIELPGILEKNWGNYFEFLSENNKFTVKNLKPCNRGLLKINCVNPSTQESSIFQIKLNGFY